MAMNEPGPAPRPETLFSPAQRKVVAAALTSLAFALVSVVLLGALGLLGWLVGRFSGVLWPLAVAGILALMLRPIVEALETRLRLRRLSAVVMVCGVLALAVGAVALTLVPPALAQILDFFAYLPVLWERAGVFIRTHTPEWAQLIERHWENPTIRALVERLGQQLQGFVKEAIPSLAAAGSGIAQGVGFITQLAVIPIYFFFFLLSRTHPADRIPDQLPFLSPSLRADLAFLAREFVSIIVSFFRGQLLIGLIMGLLYAVGFAIIGLKFGPVIGLLLGLLNVVPYLGSILGLAVTIPVALLQPDGGWQLVALTLGVQVVVQNIEGWFLTPKIMSNRTGLHPVTIIVAIFFWGTALGGLLGMILAIPLTAFFVSAWRFVRHRYLGGGTTTAAARG
jgi:predicted PurR-regulated permease PerM